MYVGIGGKAGKTYMQMVVQMVVLMVMLMVVQMVVDMIVLTQFSCRSVEQLAPVRAPQLLHRLVCAPGQLQRNLHALRLVGCALVGVQADAS